jgi:hypothetical protein
MNGYAITQEKNIFFLLHNGYKYRIKSSIEDFNSFLSTNNFEKIFLNIKLEESGGTRK